MVCLLAAAHAARLGSGTGAPGVAPAAAGVWRASAGERVDAARLPAATLDFPGATAVQLYHLRYEQVLPSGLSEVLVQRVFEIRSAPELFVLDDLWYDSARSRFQLLRAEVLRGGRVLKGSDGGDLHPGDSGDQPRRVKLPPLQAGDRVVVDYALLPAPAPEWSLLDGHYLGNLFAVRDTYPTVRVKYVLRAPQPLTVGQVGLAAPVSARSADGGYAWAWSASDQPAYFHEAGGPSLTDSSPFVQVSGFSSWAAMADWYAGVLRRRARLAPAFQQKLVSLVHPGGGATRLSPAQVRAVVNRVWAYLSAHLDYRGDEDGVHAYVPAPVEQVFAAESGDCKDGALLLATWLRAAGVEANLALVRTAAMGRVVGGPPGAGAAPATLAAFDHALVYIPVLHQWLDTTAPGLVPGELPSSDQNSLALVVGEGQGGLRRVPAAPAAANLTRRTVRLSAMSNGWFRASGVISVHGAAAPGYRARYAEAAQRRARLQAWLRRDFPQARVLSVAVSGVAPARPTVVIRFSAEIHPRRLTVAWFRRPQAVRLAAERERSAPLTMPGRWQVEESWQLRLPGGAVCTRLDPAATTRRVNRFGRLQVASTCGDGWLTVETDLVQNALEVAPGDYAAFRRFWRGVDATLGARLQLPLAPAAPAVRLARDVH